MLPQIEDGGRKFVLQVHNRHILWFFRRRRVVLGLITMSIPCVFCKSSPVVASFVAKFTSCTLRLMYPFLMVSKIAVVGKLLSALFTADMIG